ncbi:hypothetical protein [Pilimelia columellifera]|uniref:hypothetical protein n=1 Tax=Pilimelia columellifera TaxID=706574 RepID=UPI0031D97A18
MLRRARRLARHVSVSHRTLSAVTHADHVSDERRLLLVHGMSAYTRSGIIGRPSLGTAAKGRSRIESLVRSFRSHLDAMR